MKIPFTLCLMLFCIQSVAGVVIVHPNNTATFDERSIRKLYLAHTTVFPDGNDAVLLLPNAGDTRRQFIINVIDKSENQFSAYNARLLFTGQGNPPINQAERDITRLIGLNPSMMGVVSDDKVTDGVKVVYRFD